jgi:hypothetical protein
MLLAAMAFGGEPSVPPRYDPTGALPLSAGDDAAAIFERGTCRKDVFPNLQPFDLFLRN